MNARLEQKLTMYRSTHEFMVENADVFTAANVPILLTYTTDLGDQIESIDTNLLESEVSTIPVTENKKNARFALIESVSYIASAAYAYAVNTNNIILQEQLKPWRKESTLAKLKDELLTPQAQNIHDLIVVIVTVTPPAVNPLANYGIAAADTTALQALITAYLDIINAPYSAIEARKAVNTEIKETIFPTTDTLVGLIDDMIYSLRISYPELAEGYFAARNIFDPVVTHTGFRGTVIDAITLMPIQGVKVTALPSNIAPPGEDGVPVSTVTDEDGYYTLATPQYKNNPYTVRFTKTGLQEQQLTDKYVKRGKKNTLNVSMEMVTP